MATATHAAGREAISNLIEVAKDALRVLTVYHLGDATDLGYIKEVIDDAEKAMAVGTIGGGWERRV